MALQGASESGHSAIPESVLSTSRSLPCHKVGMKLEKEVERVVELEQAKNMLEIAGTVMRILLSSFLRHQLELSHICRIG